MGSRQASYDGSVRRVFWPLVGVAVLLALTGAVPALYVFPPLAGLLVYCFGVATLGSLRRGASYVPDGPPEPVDLRQERILYWCAGCGAELLLLVRGAESAPRHCGERMTERREVASQRD